MDDGRTMKTQQGPTLQVVHGEVGTVYKTFISNAASSKLMRVLRDGLYTSAILAVLREPGTNAMDVHSRVGTPERPFDLELPTEAKPQLRIRDYGTGLSEPDIALYVPGFGETDKDDSDEETGHFGLGMKSPWAYSDVWTITSWHAGTRSVYQAAIESPDRGILIKILEEPSVEPAGIQITIPVQDKDIARFVDTAADLFQYFDPVPNQIGDTYDKIKPLNVERVGDGFFTRDAGHEGWIGQMGCVPYRLRLGQLRDLLEEEKLWDGLARTKGGLFIPMGKVDIVPSREELKYTDRTRTYVVSRLRELFDAYIETRLVPQLKGKDHWSLRRQANVLQNEYSVVLPTQWKTWAAKAVTLYTEDTRPKRFHLTTFTSRNPIQHIAVANTYQNTPLSDPHFYYLTPDAKEKTWGYKPQGRGFLIRPLYKTQEEGFAKELWSKQEVLEELIEVMARAQIVGIPIEDITSLPYEEPYVAPKKVKKVNIKHRKKLFKLKTMRYGRPDPASDAWEPVSVVPAPTDLFTVISRFHPEKLGQKYLFWEGVQFDHRLAKALDIEFPVIYGYKTTARKPIEAATIVKRGDGVHYTDAFRRKWWWDHLRREHKTILYEAMLVERATFDTYRSYSGSKKGVWDRGLDALDQELGSRHPLVRFLHRVSQAQDRAGARNRHQSTSIWSGDRVNHAYKLLKEVIPTTEVDRLLERYPLLTTHTIDLGYHSTARKIPFEAFFGDDAAHWIQYVRLVDAHTSTS
jgi:hypothetical protein